MVSGRIKRRGKCLHTPHVALVIRPLILKRVSSFSDRRLLHRYNIMIKLASRRFHWIMVVDYP